MPQEIFKLGMSRSLQRSCSSGAMHKPSPQNFTDFVPWAAFQWQLPFLIEIIVIRTGEFVSGMWNVHRTPQHTLTYSEDSSSSGEVPQNDEPTLCIKTYYNKDKKLCEIELLKPQFNIPVQVIHILNIVLPYHPDCQKLNLKGLKIDCNIVYEVSKLLNKSNLTEVCFDNTFLPEGNYYTLLENETNLHYLSLSNCRLNSLACKMIANRITMGRPAEKKLKMLNLSSNDIGDTGAKSLGVALRTNRTLLYLNICNNKITDNGIRHILDSLMEFPLTYDEIIRKRTRFLEYVKVKYKLHKEESEKPKLVSNSKKKKKKGTSKLPKSSKSKLLSETNFNNSKEEFCNIIKDEWADIFSYNNTVIKNKYIYSVGNFNLCYLNIAFNNIEYQSVMKLYEVLTYQSMKNFGCGLLKVVLDGNKMPVRCELFNLISVLLKTACDQASIEVKLHRTPTTS